MKLGTEDKKKLGVAVGAGACALGAVIYLYTQYFAGPSTPPTPAAPVIINGDAAAKPAAVPGRTVAAPPGFATAGNAQRVGTTSGQLDPTLHMEAMRVTESLVYTGSGRNIFSGGSSVANKPAVVAVKANFPARTTQQTVALPPVQTGPPPPPPINLKFFGTSTDAKGVRKAFLLQGDDVFLAATGDIVQRKYRVISIAPSTVLIEDIPNNNKQTLPMIPN